MFAQKILALSMLGMSALGLSSIGHAADPYVKTCNHRDGGSGTYGEYPGACDADQFGDTSRIDFVYKALTFDRTTKDSGQRSTYVTRMHAFVRDTSAQYYRRREPQASPAEVEFWSRAILAVAAQETFWSHYRIGSDGRQKLMMGDNQDSHGMMQIDQKYNAHRDRENSFDLYNNVAFANDQFYTDFKRADKMGCYQTEDKVTEVKGKDGKKKKVVIKGLSGEALLIARARSAYSAYNGGSGKICRWTNPKDDFMNHDKQYFEKIQKQDWLTLVTDRNQASPVDVQCLANDDLFCVIPKDKQELFLKDRPMLLENGLTCLTSDGGHSYTCTDEVRSLGCLGVNSDILDRAPVKLNSLPAGVEVKKLLDRDVQCQKQAPGLAAVGEYIKINRAMKVRDEIGGAGVGTTRPGQVFQVLDYQVLLGEGLQRFYRIRLTNGTEGYIAAGNNETAETWASKVTDAASIKKAAAVIPAAGTKLTWIGKKPAAILGSAQIKSETVGKINRNADFTVDGLEIHGDENLIFARVTQGTTAGYVYIGRTYPETTLDHYVKVKP